MTGSLEKLLAVRRFKEISDQKFVWAVRPRDWFSHIFSENRQASVWASTPKLSSVRQRKFLDNNLSVHLGWKQRSLS